MERRKALDRRMEVNTSIAILKDGKGHLLMPKVQEALGELIDTIANGEKTRRPLEKFNQAVRTQILDELFRGAFLIGQKLRKEN